MKPGGLHCFLSGLFFNIPPGDWQHTPAAEGAHDLELMDFLVYY